MNEEQKKQIVLRKYYDKSKHNFITLKPADFHDDMKTDEIFTINKLLADKGFIDLHDYEDEETGLHMESAKITKKGIEQIKTTLRF